MKKVGETTRLFSYDQNKIPYDYYTVEVRNKCKGLDLIDRVPEELWKDVRDIVLEAVIKIIPKKKKCKKQNGCLRRPYKQMEKKRSKRQRRKRKTYTSEYRIQKNSKER